MGKVYPTGRKREIGTALPEESGCEVLGMQNRKTKNRNKKWKSGFTLVELIVTLVILSIITAVATPALLGYIDEGRAKECETRMKALAVDIASARSAYEMDGEIGDGAGEFDQDQINAYVATLSADNRSCPEGGDYECKYNKSSKQIEIHCVKHNLTEDVTGNEKFKLDVALTQTEAPDPSAEPSATPAEKPSAEPSATPTDEPSAEPSATPTDEPSAEPSATPTEEPSAEPSATPTEEPSAEPSATPTEEPSAEPSATPTGEPSAEPSATPGEQSTEKESETEPKKENEDSLTSNTLRVWTDGMGDPVNVQYEELLALMDATEGGKWVDHSEHVKFDQLGNVQVYDQTRGGTHWVEYQSASGDTARVTIQIGYAIKSISQFMYKDNASSRNFGEEIEVEAKLDPEHTTDVRADRPIQWSVTNPADESPAKGVKVEPLDERAQNVVVTSSTPGNFKLIASVTSEKPDVGTATHSESITFNPYVLQDIIVPTTLQVKKGESAQIDVQLVPAAGSNLVTVQKEYSYSSENIEIEDGTVYGLEVTGNDPVSVNVKVTVGEKTLNRDFKVRVLPKDAIQMSAAPLDLQVGDKAQIQVSCMKGNESVALPNDMQLSYALAKGGSNNISLGNSTGKVQANSKTEAGSPEEVIVTAKDNNGAWLAECSCYVTVRPKQKTVRGVAYNVVSWQEVQQAILNNTPMAWPQIYYSQVDRNGKTMDCFCILKRGQTFADDVANYTSIEDYIKLGGYGDQFLIGTIDDNYVPDVMPTDKPGDFRLWNEKLYMCLQEYSSDDSFWGDRGKYVDQYYVLIPQANN